MSAWSKGGRAVSAGGFTVCGVWGCAREPYRFGRCTYHWESQPEETCKHTDLVLIMCGCCGRRVCEACYGSWNALACGRCRGV